MPFCYLIHKLTNGCVCRGEDSERVTLMYSIKGFADGGNELISTMLHTWTTVTERRSAWQLTFNNIDEIIDLLRTAEHELPWGDEYVIKLKCICIIFTNN